ncbi:MAG: PEP-CTERM sorting domain-containing protein [Cyanobacteria bacterium P01_D01_bin.105]
MNLKLGSLSLKKVSALAASATALCVVGVATEAQAAQLFATEVVYYETLTNDVSADRGITDYALGAPQFDFETEHFLSLGKGGRAVFNFGQDFAGEVNVWETTYGTRTHQGSWDESIDIYYGNFDSDNFDSDVTWESIANDLSQWEYAGDIENIADNAFDSPTGASNADYVPQGVFNHVLLVDTSARSGGFDVNAIAVQGVEQKEVPEPAALAGLLMVGAMGLKTRRKSSAAA